jgi:hypothetical protein
VIREEAAMAERRTVATRADALLNRERILSVAYQTFAYDAKVSLNAIGKLAGVGAGSYRELSSDADSNDWSAAPSSAMPSID